MRYRRGSGCTRDGKPVAVAPDEEKLSRSYRDSDRPWGSGCAAIFDIRWFPNDLESHHHIASLPLPYSPCPRPRISYRPLEKFHTSNPFQYWMRMTWSCTKPPSGVQCSVNMSSCLVCPHCIYTPPRMVYVSTQLGVLGFIHDFDTSICAPPPEHLPLYLPSSRIVTRHVG